MITSLFAACCAVFATFVSEKLHRRLEVDFFKNSAMFHLCTTIWLTGFIIQSLHSYPDGYVTAAISHVIFSPFLYLGLAFLVSATESVKGSKRSFLEDISFLLAGIMIAGGFHRDSFTLTWTAIGWVQEFHPLYLLGRIMMVLLCFAALLPLAIRARKRLTFSIRSDQYLVIPMAILAVLLPITMTLYGQGYILSYLPPILMYPEVVTTVTGFFLLWVGILLSKHPTILFSTINDILDLYIIDSGSGLPQYSYSFGNRKVREGGEVLSAFFTSIRHFVKQEIAAGEIEKIVIGDSEVVVCDGLFCFGILLARKSSRLVQLLLEVILSEFEAAYAFELTEPNRTNRFSEFDYTIERYFEFALRGSFAKDSGEGPNISLDSTDYVHDLEEST